MNHHVHLRSEILIFIIVKTHDKMISIITTNDLHHGTKFIQTVIL